MKKHKRKIFLIIGVILLVFCFVLLNLRGYRILQSRTFRKFYDRIDFKIDTKELKIPEDALAFSVYDIDKEKYLFYEGGGQLPTVASLSKLFAIDYALTKVKLEDSIEVNQELLNLVPQGSSMAHLKPGKYTAEQIMQAMLVPSGNDAAFALAYNIGKKDLGDGYSAEKYVNYFVKNLSKYLADEGYSKTHLFDPSGFSIQADTNLKDINRVTLKLIDYDFVKKCMGKSSFSIKTSQGEFTWENTNEFLDPKSAFYNKDIKGVKTGTMASSYNIVVLYEKDGEKYLITCLASHTNEDRYKAVQAAINTIINKK